MYRPDGPRPVTSSLTRQRIHHVADKTPERLVLDKLLVDLRVVFEEDLYHLAERLVVGHARRVRRVLLGVLIGLVGGDLRRDVVANPLPDAVDSERIAFRFTIAGSERPLGRMLRSSNPVLDSSSNRLLRPNTTPSPKSTRLVSPTSQRTQPTSSSRSSLGSGESIGRRLEA